MTSKVFIGNLPFKTRESDLVACFEAAGQVVNANIVTRDGRSLGYGFVEYANPEAALQAIDLFDKKDFDGRVINVELSNSTIPTKGINPTANLYRPFIPSNHNPHSYAHTHAYTHPHTYTHHITNTATATASSTATSNNSNLNAFGAFGDAGATNPMMGYSSYPAYQGFSFGGSAGTTSSSAGGGAGVPGLAGFTDDSSAAAAAQSMFGEAGFEGEDGKIHPSVLYAMKYSPYFRPYYPENQAYSIPTYNLYDDAPAVPGAGTATAAAGDDGDDATSASGSASGASSSSPVADPAAAAAGIVPSPTQQQQGGGGGEIPLGDPAGASSSSTSTSATSSGLGGVGLSNLADGPVGFGAADGGSLFYQQSGVVPADNLLYGYGMQQQQHQQQQQPFPMRGVWNGNRRQQQQQYQQFQHLAQQQQQHQQQGMMMMQGGGGSGGGGQRRVPYEERQISGDTVFVTGLPLDYDDAKLADLFADEATVKKAYVVRYRTSNKSKGFGFVTFETEAEKDHILTTMKEIRVGDNILTVKTSYVPTKKIY